ncbi:gliding motility lipoprotein GldH [Flavobacterium sp. ASW18X]|uniref:gliding motility lipoprotein GldH n=1 Tax=Flavobacterium sp. ASW18X TaxID=2572595 RepID=UPI0010ADAFEF|nr:gliding motility lipoprotein GldH [Flavobacterium sp. ASW18X]TKD65043.1 gliding motility lipoprotein GldH [Flavobacterium sp. ASW18X]
MKNSLLLIGLALLLLACNTNIAHTEYIALNNGVWKSKDTLTFSFKELDTTATYQLFLNIRNDDTYEFSNLFLITELQQPNDQVLVDTLEYKMAQPTGEWLGRGTGSVKESKLWLKENINFSSSGVYTLKVQHAMRKNGSVNGVEDLTGITDVGLQIETIK